MVIFPVFLVASLVLFVYFKVLQLRTKGPGERELYSAKATIALSIFIITFGVNSYINLQTTTAAVVGLIFLVLGGVNLYFGIKRHQHFKPLALQERKEK
ncbi:YtpI family protein [Alkalicoccus saliphilus]|jgi:hypothetical protein|uniref:YtpI-like protein n=1 Tax=Alkalicoccus saliphilus TaxID=200989 RepID=A0A2T4U8Z1_9BACI|nr:YtpI family protein [Alkalicoccus saliphilus]PTL39850.1 hypothetical protein C6Y45_04185 [Alkalicoccus saliphilus]